MGFLSNLFSKKPNKVQEALIAGATIIDVRSATEFSGGHVRGSVNIPLDQVKHKINKIKKLKSPLVLCCASGMRSANATSILKDNNFEEVYNGGSWSKVNRLLSN